jgi:transposase-like protein
LKKHKWEIKTRGSCCATNTKEIAKEYRLTHWAQIIKERKESGLSIRAFCKKAGYHENNFFYWQRKLREEVCGQMNLVPTENAHHITPNFVEVKMSEAPLEEQTTATSAQLLIEIAGIQLKADSSYPIDKLAILVRKLVLPC